MMMRWEDAARAVENQFGDSCYVNWEDKCFECPECGALIDGHKYPEFEVCPVCENTGVDGIAHIIDGDTEWGKIARYMQSIYGVFVDWEERFFICPDCDEPLYECDWSPNELNSCPICEYEWYEEE